MEQELVKKNDRTPEIEAAEIRTFTASMLNNIIEIGRRLCEVKEMLPHGKFGSWIQENTGYSVSTANNFMNLYREYGAMQGSLFGAEANSQTFGNLTYSKALALLAVPAEEREAFVRDNNVEDMSTRQLQDAIRERDAALSQMEFTRSQLEKSNKQITKLNGELAKTRESEEKALAKASHAEESRLKMEADMRLVNAELKELRNRPVDVAVQRDEAAIEAARREVRAEMQSELDKVNAALDDANRTAKEAAESENKLRQELAEARKAKESGTGNSQVVSEFKAYYDQTQELVNKMNGLLLKLFQKDPETAGKLGNALIALSDAIKREAAIQKEVAV